MRAVLVGCGAMSKAWLEALRHVDGVSVSGLVDLDVSRAAARAKEFGLSDAVVGSDLETVLARAKPDMVFDVAFPAARRDIALKALARGCHILTEKPLADSRENAEAIVAAARKAGRRHAVVQNRRYVANVRRIRRLLDSGAIGKPTSIHADFFIAPHFGGFREEMRHVLLLDMAIHTFDAARFMVNADPKSVYCEEWDPEGSWYAQGSSAAALFGFEGGAVFTYRGSWCADGLRTSWESAWRIVGAEGSLVWDGLDDVRAERRTGLREGIFDAPEPIHVPPLDPRDRVGGHTGVIEDFVAAIRAGIAPETRGDDNIKSLAMVLGAIESAETGRRVPILV